MSYDLSDWSLLRVFMETVQAGSMRSAQTRLGMSQPTIGRKIDLLEQEVGAQLLVRTMAGVYLTEQGRHIMQIAEQMDTMARMATARIASKGETSGTVRFKGSDGIGGYWLPLSLSNFNRQYPHITIEAVCTDFSHIPDLTRLEADITVVYAEPTHPDVCVISKSELVLKPVASKNYAAEFGLPNSFERLLSHPVIVHESYMSEDGAMAPLAKVLQQHKKIVFKTNSSIAVGQAARCGIGVTYLPVGAQKREPDLIFFDIEGWTPRMPFWLVCHKDVKDLPHVRAVIEYMKSSLFSKRIDGSMSYDDKGHPVSMVSAPAA